MSTHTPSTPAAPFSLTDTTGRIVTLADLTSTGPVVLVFNRGFA
ncbi:MAG TPA: hypothetical protein PKW33_01170 [Anaerolineaceae bacterium]|nr:hypothetical protein [Anaerolineaceae bacterium]HPN50167.1 hypothetical protein [Anaerolineaceae bacterium]